MNTALWHHSKMVCPVNLDMIIYDMRNSLSFEVLIRMFGLTLNRDIMISSHSGINGLIAHPSSYLKQLTLS